LLIGAGIDPTTVSGVLGHSQVSTTLSIYTHEFQDAQARTSDIVANALDFNKKKSLLYHNSRLKVTQWVGKIK